MSSSHTDVPGTKQWYEFAFNNEILTGGKTYIIAVTLSAGGPTLPQYNGSPGYATEEFRSASAVWPDLTDPLGAADSLWTTRDSCMYLECEDASVPLQPPTWTTIPAQNTSNSIARTLDVTPYASSSAGGLSNWALVNPPVGFSINSATGVITCAPATEPNTYAITARVANNDGATSSAPFAWTVNAAVLSSDYTAVGTTTAVLRYTVPYLPSTVSSQAYSLLRKSGSPRNSNIQIEALGLPVAQNVPGVIYAAIRTSGPYNENDQAAVKAGTGAVWSANRVAQYRQSFLVDGLPANTLCYYGMYEEAGVNSPVTFGSFTTQAEPPQPTIGTPPNRRS